MGIEVSAFLINAAIGIGAKLIGSWLGSKKEPQKTIAEDIPLLGQGNPLYGIWGLSFCPGNLLYATPPSLAGHGNDRSTYGILGFSNPDSTAALLALRINNRIAASKSSIFPILAENGANNGQSVLVNILTGLVVTQDNPQQLTTLPDGLRVRKDLALFYQMAGNVPNTNFSLNGYNGLQYEGLTWVGVAASPRDIYGGVNARFVIYAKNRVTSGGLVGFTIKSDTPVNITTTLGFGQNKDYYTNTYPTYFPRGFFGAKKILAFDNAARFGIIGLSGDSEYLIHSYTPNAPIPSFIGAYSGSDLSTIKFSVTGSIAPGRPVPPVGHFPVVLYSSYVPALTTSLILAERNGKLTEYILPSPKLPPFQSVGGLVYDSGNSLIFTAAGNQRCYGWDGKIFVANSGDNVIVDSTLVDNYINPTADFSGVSETAFTNLATIVQDLIRNKLTGKTLIDTSTEIKIGGFTSDYSNVDSTIIDLCTAYGKIIFEDGEGDYWLTDYPPAIPIETFTRKDFVEKPNLEFSPEFNQPSQLEFTYRASGDQLSEKVIHVGYSNRFGSTANVKYNLSLDEDEARRLAWNVLFLRSHTNTRLIFRSNKSISRAGQVISYDGELWLVGSLEIGQDMSFRYTCVNYVPLNDGFTSYMTDSVTQSTSPPVISTQVTPFVLPAETRLLTGDNGRLGYFYSNSSGIATVRRNDSNLLAVKSYVPTTGGFTGQVAQFTMKTGDYAHGYESITIVRTVGTNFSLPISGIIRVGQSWVKFTSFSSSGSTFEISGIEVGLYGSSPIIRGGDIVVDLVQANELLGYDNVSLPLVEQNSEINYMKSQPESLINGTAPVFGIATSVYPHGFPVSGVAPAQIMASAYGGVLRIWTSRPGNQHLDFFLNDAQGGVFQTNNWFYESGLSYLYRQTILFNQNYTVNTVANVPVGSFKIYQARIDHLVANPKLYPTGSFEFTGESF
jgi:hypothetical protein